MSRKITIGITEVQYRQQTFEIIVPDEIKDDDVFDFLCGIEHECDDDVEWEDCSSSYEEDDIPGVDSNRYDVYRNDKQVTGGHF